jgi:dTMP kinase
MSLLIDIEGIDGSGKGTQAQRLCETLMQAGRTCDIISFPRYSHTLFGRIAGEFLNGRFGSLDQVHPLLAAIVFAGDRAESRWDLNQAISKNDVVIFDRYVPSNIAHQAAKLSGSEREELIQRIERIEYDIFELPRADLTILIDMPVETAQKLIARKAARDYTARAADIQEADTRYLTAVREVYHALAHSHSNWHVVAGVRNGEVRIVEEVGRDIAELVASRPG